jgi:hypothetical protein
MKNPFLDFRFYPHQREEIPLKRFLSQKKDLLDRLMQGYLRMMAVGIKDVLRHLELEISLEAYGGAVAGLQGLRFFQEDIEDFLHGVKAFQSGSSVTPAPLGIYLSALVNQSQDDFMALGLRDHGLTCDCLGYRLREGKTLILQGHGGDFVGSGLAGGCLVVEGSIGDWGGAGMKKGELLISGRAGLKTGEWMKGGEIRVDGWIGGTGKSIYGGRIYRKGDLIFPGGQRNGGLGCDLLRRHRAGDDSH